MIAFNAILLSICGSVGVAAYGVIANLSLVVIAIFTGISQGIQPLLSRRYGSGQHRELTAILRYALVSAIVIAAAVYVVTFLWAGPVTTLFNSEGNAQLQEIAEAGLRLYFIGCPFAGVNIILSVYFASIEQPVPGQVIALLRGFAVILPMAFALAAAFGLTGVWCAFPVTEAVVTGVSIVLYRRARHLPPPLR